MKISVLFALLCLSVTPYAAACEAGSDAQLLQFWSNFRQAYLSGKPEAASIFYVFPLTILGPYGDEKPIHLSKATFLSQYENVFINSLTGAEKAQTMMDAEKMDVREVKLKLAPYSDGKGCVRLDAQVRINDYNIKWRGLDGWRIYSMYYLEDFEMLAKLLNKKSKNR